MSSLVDLREHFLRYFEREGHEVVAPSSLVPRNDPTLMFTNAGMVQFRNVFTGVERRDSSRAATVQKCVRAGGRHNDLDNVGFTARHHTFFEMLGNFSFGDYSKEGAIELAWNLLTREWGLSASRLTATVYQDDDEAFDLWKRVAGLPEDRIVRLGTKSNFWWMGNSGPCGPCSEIFFDHGDKHWGGPPGSPEEDGDRFVELWSLAFMEFEQLADGARLRLPKPSVQTGMGLERVTAAVDGTGDNYQTDVFKALIASLQQETGYAGDAANPSLRVVSDHLRSMSFLIAEGVLPSNEGRGYVLRRIMRRAMRHARLLGSQAPAIHKLVPTLVRQMGQAYPELVRGEDLIEETILVEEEHFFDKLSRGLAILDEATVNLGPGDILDGVIAFKLYDTYGFPLDMTQDALRARGINVDVSRFEDAMARQRAEARKNWLNAGQKNDDTVWFSIADKVGPTEFVGYETETAEGVVTALVRDEKPVEMLENGQEGYVVLNQTAFYAEGSGQVGDTGVLSGEGYSAVVLDTIRRYGVFAHRVRLTGGEIRIGAEVGLAVNHERRSAIRANHSATHLLHEALRIVLGDHVTQRGSLISADSLRFDFVHTRPLTREELAQVEDIANGIVLENSPVETRLMNVDDAKELGARTLFGETYGDEVRVVSMGRTNEAPAWSVELCGGTHVRRTGDIGLITVYSEVAVAAGVRRIEALTARGALHLARSNAGLVASAADLLRASPAEVLTRIETLQDERRIAMRLELSPDGTPPPLPEQGHGPHFEIRDAVIDFAPPGGMAAFDRRRLEELAPLIRGLADEVADLFNRGNRPHGQIANLAQVYASLVKRDIGEISFALVFGYGVRLQSAFSATERLVETGETPDLTADQRGALVSLLDLHGPFVLASREGRELVEAAQRYQRRPTEEEAFQNAAMDLVTALQDRPEIIHPAAAEYLREVAEDVGQGEHSERSGALGTGAVRNAAVVLTAGSILAVASKATADGKSLVAAGDGPEKSDPGSGRQDFSQGASTDASFPEDLNGIRPEDFAKFAAFVLQHEKLLRELAGTRREMQWMREQIDFLLHAQAEVGSSTSTEDTLRENVLAELERDFVALVGMDEAPQQRGFAFERLLKRWFDAWGMDAHASFRTVGEQIDGSFQHDGSTYLVEAKWHSGPVDATMLHGFHGKILERPDWTRGLYVSFGGFSEGGLDAFTARRLIMMDGADIGDSLNGRFDLNHVIGLKARHHSEKRQPFVRVKDLFPR